MKFILIVFSNILLFVGQSFCVLAQDPDFAWAKDRGAVGMYTSSSFVDSAGNYFSTGGFSGTIDFDPGPGVYNLTSNGSDAFVSKLDANGNFVWAKSWGGSSSVAAHAITVDRSGNVYSTGSFQGLFVEFDPAGGGYDLTSVGNSVYISKLDANGNFVWANTFYKNPASQDCFSISTDNAGNVYTAGYFGASADFDPNAGTYILTTPANTVCSFVSKLDSNGNFVWAKMLGGADNLSSCVLKAMTVDTSGNVYCSGRFYGTVDMDPGVATFNLSSFNGANDAFMSKLNASGNFVWAKEWGNEGDDEASSLKLDHFGNVFTSGIFFGVVDFDPGPAVSNLNYINGPTYVSKLDTSGKFKWVKSWAESINSLAVDKHGSVYTTGSFSGTVDFDPGPGVHNLVATLPATGITDAFVSKLDSAGIFGWAISIGDSEYDNGLGICVDTLDAVYSYGTYRGTVDFDPGAGTYTLSSPSVHIYIQKLSQGVIIPVTLTDFRGSVSGKFNQLQWTTATEINNDHFDLERSSDGRNYHPVARIGAAGNSSQLKNYQYLDSFFTGNVNFYRLKQVDYDGRYSLSQVVVIRRSNESEFIAYPNPTDGIIQLESKNGVAGYAVRIFNSAGQCIFDERKIPGNTVIDISKQPAGIYSLQVSYNEKNNIIKIIKR